MIDAHTFNAINRLTKLIAKYSKNAYPEVETVASSENRRRAWILTKLLSRLAAHAAECDFYSMLAADPGRTNADRDRCYQVSRQEDIEFLKVWGEFEAREKEFNAAPAVDKTRTDTSLIHEIERLYWHAKFIDSALQQAIKDATHAAATKAPAKQRKASLQRQFALTDTRLEAYSNLAAAKELARARGMAVSVTKARTIVKECAVPA